MVRVLYILSQQPSKDKQGYLIPFSNLDPVLLPGHATCWDFCCWLNWALYSRWTSCHWASTVGSYSGFHRSWQTAQVVAYACFSSLLLLRDRAHLRAGHRAGHQPTIVLSRAQYSVGKNCLELEFGFGRLGFGHLFVWSGIQAFTGAGILARWWLMHALAHYY